MKKLCLILLAAILLVGSAVGPILTPAYAQGYPGYSYPAPPQYPYANPWVGSNTPWVYYNGDWFLNGILHYFFGPKYGWAPYYSYPRTYIVRPHYWYEPKWNVWYQGHPQYWDNFHRNYPYWRGHRHGRYYDQRFYNEHHHGQGGGWHGGRDGGRHGGRD